MQHRVHDWLCPSDGTNGGGRLPSNTPDGQWTDQPIDPSTGTTAAMTPVSNYAGSFGDNYCGGVLCAPGLPWETPWNATPAVGQPRIGWNGYWGTSFGLPDGFTLGAGTMRGYFDYRSTQKPPNIATITDGTSNTIMAGEVMPSSGRRQQLLVSSTGLTPARPSRSAGTPTPYPCRGGQLLQQLADPTAPDGCRFSAAAKGFVSLHPGGSNFAFGDGSVQFPQEQHQHDHLLRPGQPGRR